MVINVQLIVQDDDKLLKALHCLHWPAVGGNGAIRGGVYKGVQDELSPLGDVEEEVFSCATCDEVCNSLLVGCD